MCRAHRLARQSLQLGLPEAELHHNEILTPRALELLRARHPSAGALLKDGIARKDLVALVSVEGIAATVERKLAAPR